MKLKTKDLLLLVLAFAVAFLIWQKYSGPDINPEFVSREFTGQIDKVDDKTIYMTGNFTVAGHPELLGREKAIEAKVKVTNATKLVKILIYRPADLISSGKVVDPRDLKQEVTTGSLDDLAGGTVDGATVVSDVNIYGRSKFDASTITYYWAVDQ